MKNAITVTIEKDIDVPTTIRKGWSKYQTVFDNMEIGDSFLITMDKYPNNFRRAASNWRKECGGKIITRTVKDGVRFWCVETASSATDTE